MNNGKRVTIYDIAQELGMTASYVSRALNDHPLVSRKIKELVKKKALELNYKLNFRAANLRKGSSQTIGVIVPHIDQSFFSEAIAGIEEICFANNHSLIICQSHESFKQECKVIDTLIHQHVDCILISISAETESASHLETIQEHNIELIQFDRCLDKVEGYKVINDNKDASYKAVNNLIEQGYKKIAFIGGPEHIGVFKNRKKGYLEAINEAGLSIPYHFVVDNAFTQQKAKSVALELMSLPDPPDAFFTVSDHQSLAVLQVAESMGVKVPEQIGIFGFANEAFSAIIKPALSSVDQNSKELGKHAANLYFKQLGKPSSTTAKNKKEIIKSKIIVRQSSMRKNIGNKKGLTNNQPGIVQ